MQLFNSSNLQATAIPSLNNLNEKIVSIPKMLEKQKETKHFSCKLAQVSSTQTNNVKRFVATCLGQKKFIIRRPNLNKFKTMIKHCQHN